VTPRAQRSSIHASSFPVTFEAQAHAASWTEWVEIRKHVLARAGWRCQACGVKRRLDVHHVVKRSQGGSAFDQDLVVALCRWCRDQIDALYERERLVVTAFRSGLFCFDLVRSLMPALLDTCRVSRTNPPPRADRGSSPVGRST
jgi:hypothetical protein